MEESMADRLLARRKVGPSCSSQARTRLAHATATAIAQQPYWAVAVTSGNLRRRLLTIQLSSRAPLGADAPSSRGATTSEA